jgi:hypothetical protein
MNSAQRLYELLNQAAKLGDRTPTYDVWAKVLEIPQGYQRNKLVAEVSARLSALHQEMEALHASMLTTEIPQEVFEPPLRKVEAAISATNISAQWASFKKHITPEVILALRYNSAILGAQENPIGEDELAALLQEVADLEDSLASTDLNAEIKALVERQILSIRQALGDYKIKGATAIKDAIHKAAGELIEHKEIVVANHDSEVIGRLGQLWLRLTQLGDALTKLDSALETGKKMWALIEPVFKSVQP